MKKIVILIVVVIAGLFGFFFLREDTKEVVQSTAVYSDTNMGFEFTYKTGSQGYVLEESTPSNSEDFLKKITLRQKQENTKEVVGGEDPATISVSVFKNIASRQPSVWVMENSKYSNYNLKQSDLMEAVVGGANAVKYKADGLYASDNVVVAHGGYVYLFTGMYIDADSMLRKDFLPLVDSVKFIPTPSSTAGAKINIDEVCNGALAYMTFPDGKTADAFVADCKEGKHPEVIEKFKKDMGLGSGAAI